MGEEKINKVLKARCEECGSENVAITGSTIIEAGKESDLRDYETYYFQCSDCGNVFYIIKEPK